MPNSEPTPVEVIQADCDAADALAGCLSAPFSPVALYGVRLAFARHRISHAAPVPREPTAEMVKAGSLAAFKNSPALVTPDEIWRAMHDAALKAKGNG